MRLLQFMATVGFAASAAYRSAPAATIPAAEFSSSINFNVAGGTTTSAKEGSISYDYRRTYVNGYGETVNDQYVASVKLTGGNLLTVDVHGDFRVHSSLGYPRADTSGMIRYYFAVEKKDPAAPDYPVPFLIRAKAHASVQRAGTGNSSPGAEAKVYYKHPSSPYQESLLNLYVISYDDARAARERVFEGLRAQPPGAIGMMRIEGVAAAGTMSSYGTGSYQVIVDPIILIDPLFTVMIDGVERLGTDVYGLEFSEGIGPGVPEPTTAALSSILLVTVLLRRRVLVRLE
jgi:hypothetical protein